MPNGAHKKTGPDPNTCKNCQGYIRRRHGDRFLKCHRCGWIVSYPGLRWLTHPTWIKYYLNHPVQAGKDLLQIFVLWVFISAAVIYLTPVQVYIPVQTSAQISSPLETPKETSNESNTTFPQGFSYAFQGSGGDAAPSSNNSEGTSSAASSEEFPDTKEIERSIHRFTNAERSEHRLGTINTDSQLASIARKHSQDMAEREFFSHVTPGGVTMTDRYQRAGYDCRVPISQYRYLTGAENIHMTYFGQRVRINGETRIFTNETEVGRAVVESWMNSPPHRENILNPHWRREGIGVTVTDDGRVYATQNFC